MVVSTYMVEVEIALVAAQVILLLVSDKGLVFMPVSCVYQSRQKTRQPKVRKAYRPKRRSRSE